MKQNKRYKDLEIISKIIAKKYNKTPESIFEKTRVREIIDLRGMFFYFATRHTTLSLNDIGKFSLLMGRDKQHHHATVLHSVNRVYDMMFTEKDFRETIDELDNEIKYYVDYDRLHYDQISIYKKIISNKVHQEQDLDFLSKFSGLTTILYENKEFLDITADLVQEKLTRKLQKITDEGIHKTAQEDIRLGMV